MEIEGNGFQDKVVIGKMNPSLIVKIRKSRNLRHIAIHQRTQPTSQGCL